MFEYTKEDLNIMAKELKFNRDTLEKVIRLIKILDFINTDSQIKEKLVLKGASHGPLDVAPWVLLGTGRDDPTSMGDRLMSLIRAAPAKIEATAKKGFNWE
mgnify:CR=1 FL=1